MGTWLSEGNYLRVRGEYPFPALRPRASLELPPRARRIPFHIEAGHVPRGTTSACAENTVCVLLGCLYGWNYLRVRGEYPTHATRQVPQSELPPRARRIPPCKSWGRPNRGTTSACAENTQFKQTTPPPRWNYLRVRGEYDSLGVEWIIYTELPPRARRILLNIEHKTKLRGTTSACAENTIALVRGMAKIRNYLRVRGEYSRSQRHG